MALTAFCTKLRVGLDQRVGSDDGEQLIAGGADDALDFRVVGAVHNDHTAGVQQLLGGPGVGGDGGLDLVLVHGGQIAGAGDVGEADIGIRVQTGGVDAGLNERGGAAVGTQTAGDGLAFQGVKGGVRLVGADQLVGVLLCGGENYLAALAGLVDHEGGLDALQAELGVPGQNRGGGVAPLDGLEFRVQALFGKVAQGLGPGRRGPSDSRGFVP